MILDYASPADIEYIVGGAENQLLRILSKNSNATLKHNFGSSPGSIRTNTGADKLLSADVIYTLTYYQGVWYESE